MTLMNCPDCQGKLSDKAFTCPHCGFPLVQQKGKSAWPPVMPGRTNIEVHAQGLHYPQGQSELAGLLAVLQVDDKPHTNIGNQCQVWLGQLQSLANFPYLSAIGTFGKKRCRNLYEMGAARSHSRGNCKYSPPKRFLWQGSPTIGAYRARTADD